jgi:hypothetical protein
MIEAGYVIIAAAVLLWAYVSIPRASLACGDAAPEAYRLRQRFLLAALAWTALTLVLAWTGMLARFDWRPPPFMLLFVGILVLGVVIARSRVGDRLAYGLPLAALVGLQSFRFPLEVVMHRTAERGIMPMQMSYSGLNFDILTGLSAVALAVWLRLGRPPRGLVWAWNVMGLLLLANIVTVAVLSTPRFAAFGSAPEKLNTFVTRAPYVLLPTVLVLAAWAGHLIVFRALRRPQAGSPRIASHRARMSAG